MHDPALHLELDLEDGNPVAGSLRGPDGSERRFTGWLDLIAALESARHPSTDTEQPEKRGANYAPPSTTTEGGTR